MGRFLALAVEARIQTNGPAPDGGACVLHDCRRPESELDDGFGVAE